jgi:hypothetical protein
MLVPADELDAAVRGVTSRLSPPPSLVIAESLANILKHARATIAQVNVRHRVRELGSRSGTTGAPGGLPGFGLAVWPIGSPPWSDRVISLVDAGTSARARLVPPAQR